MSKVKYCEYCKNHPEICKQVILRGYSNFWQANLYECPVCKNKMVDTVLDSDEMKIIEKISTDIDFFESMISLKENDPIEFQLKMSQFKASLAQQKKAEESSKPHCPHCNSTNIKSLSMLNRGASIALFGAFSKKINKSFECLDCKYTW